jgi:transcription initiation factor TFIIF subunit alpha
MNRLPPAAPTNGQQQPQQPPQQPPPERRRRPRPKEGPLRAPRRPLKNITRPLVSLSEMNESKKHASSATVDSTKTPEALRNEFVQRGASTFPLVVTRRDLKELRYHVMRLQNKTHVDIQDPNQFATPIRLHRRDPRAPPSGAGSHFEDEDTKEDLEETKERERIEQQREERRKVREENQAKIAPTGTKKPPAFQKKTEQKYRPDDTPEAKKRQLLRYEETLPWHLEDFENRQTWAGTYESEMSETHVMLSTTPQGAIQMAPIERWYRFNVKGKVKPTGDDLDKVMFKVEAVPGFLRNIEKRAEAREKDALQSRNRYGLSTRVGGGADDEGRIRQARTDDGYIKREADADDIDFNLDEDFADDEEGLNGLFEGDEQEVKEAAEKLKRDQLAAALWERNEQKIHEEEEREKREAEVAKELERGLRKTLVKRGKLFDFADSDMSDESETDSETERQRAKEEEEKKAAEQKAIENGTAPSGTSTKGSNTPLGSSTPSANKPTDKFKSKKRPNSEMSEASGNESSRVKKKKKNKLVVGLQGSPTASASTSRAGSPAPSSPAAPRLPSAREIYDSLPPQGMGIQPLIALFKGRVDKSNTQLFIRLVKAVSSFDKGKSWLTPLPSMPTEEHIAAAMSASKTKMKA